jgi:hypothetical protein
MSPLQEQVRTQTPWILEALGFRIIGDTYDPRAFGNSIVTLQSAEVRLRFIRDRDQILAELASLAEPDKWWNLVFLLEAIHGAIPQSRFELEAVAAMLRDNFPRLVEALGPELAQTKQELERRRQERLKALQQPSR